jgi:hypothetical protein
VIKKLTVLVTLLFSTLCGAEQITTIDPNLLQQSGYVHAKLPVNILARIKATTDVFELVDGINYEKAVDLYRRDVDPESNLVIFEEMARVYKDFCVKRCKLLAEKQDVYKALLIRSMYKTEQALSLFKPVVISRKEAELVIRQYRLEEQPIIVYKK